MFTETLKIVVDELTLTGQLMIPGRQGSSTIRKKYPGLILCHGIPRDPTTRSESTEMTYPDLVEQFCRQGFVSIFFNFRGTGPSEGDFGIKGWIKDLKAVIDEFKNHPYLDRKRVLLCGSSAGAAVSIIVAAEDESVNAVVCLASPARFARLEEADGASAFVQEAKRIGLIRNRDFPLSLEEWRNEFKESRPVDYVAKIAPRPLLIVHGADDDVVPVNQAYELYERAKDPKELKIFSGKGHRLRVYPEVISFILTWLREKNTNSDH